MEAMREVERQAASSGRSATRWRDSSPGIRLGRWSALVAIACLLAAPPHAQAQTTGTATVQVVNYLGAQAVAGTGW